MSPSFLDLPSSCRNEIYILSGLTRACPIDITNEHRRMKNGDTINDTCYLFKYRACTYLKHRKDSEMPRSKCEKDHFICFGPALSFSLFLVSKQVSHEASAIFYSTNKFIVQVTQASDLSWSTCLSRHAISALTSLHINFQPNDIAPPQLKLLLVEWSAMIDMFAKHFTPLQLSFTLTSQSPNPKLTRTLLESIKFLPQLVSCALSFASPLDLDLRSSVRSIGAQLTGQAPASKPTPFPFERLPQELRLQILKNTDLIRRSNADSAYGSVDMERYSTWASPRNKCCSLCNDCLEFCCCIWKPAAYSRTCICAPVSPALFFVGRQISKEAQEIFFSENIFILTRPLASIKFIEGLNDFQLSCIRRLELQFRENDAMVEWHSRPEIVQPCWNRVVEILRTRLNLEKLELRLNLTRFNDPMDMYYDDSDMGELKNILREIMEPLKELSGIHRLFIYLGYFEDMEAEVEKGIMGLLYDAIAEGKPPAFDYL